MNAGDERPVGQQGAQLGAEADINDAYTCRTRTTYLLAGE